MASNDNLDLPPSIDAPSVPIPQPGLNSEVHLAPSPQYSQRSGHSFRHDSDAVSIATLPPPYAPNIGASNDEIDANYSSIVGKQSTWYHGVRYSTDELWKAALNGNAGAIQKCLKAGLSVNYCRWVREGPSDNGVRSIADIIAAKNDIRSMRLLIEHKVDLTGAVVSVFANNRLSEARMIYDQAELELMDNDMWTTPLHEACKTGKIDMINILLDEGGVNPHTMDHRQRTGLFIATKSKKTAIVQRLLSCGAAIESENTGGVTPLASAAYAGSADIVDLLLQSGAKIDIADVRGETALYNASLTGHHNIIAKLVASGADINVRNLAGTSAFFTAASRFKKDTMISLIEFGADIDIPDANGCTALLRAVMARNTALLRFLLEQGADIDAPDDRGWTPLFAAMIHGDESLIRLLLDNGSDIHKPDLHGNTPLHQAAMLNSVIVVRHILAHQTPTSAPTPHTQVNVFGETALSLACKYNNIGVVKILLKHGADATFIDPNGFAALDRALYRGNYACAQHILASSDADIEALINDNTITSLQAGRFDHANNSPAKYDLLVRLVRDKAEVDVTSLPKAPPSPQRRDLFSLAITRDELKKRMRLKQRRPAPVDPETGVVPSQVQRDSDAAGDPFEASIPKPATPVPAPFAGYMGSSVGSNGRTGRTGMASAALAGAVGSMAASTAASGSGGGGGC